MRFQDEDIQKLAALSRIKLSPQEVAKYRDQLTSILEYVDQIARVDVSNETPVKDVQGVFRDDIKTPPEASKEDLMNAAPETDDGHVSVLNVK